ncbi:MAG: MASE3 domain-containing protein [Ghiorsea sp.]
MPIILSCILIAVSFYSFLTFHTLAETLTVIVGVLMFVIALYSHPFSRDNFLLFLGSGYFWIAFLDMIHALLYKGMGADVTNPPDAFVQLWLAARFFESIILFIAPFVFIVVIRPRFLFVALGILSVSLFLIIMNGYFPTAFIDGEGLTAFKINSEYVICLILFAALANLYIHRDEVDPQMFPFLVLSIVLTIFSELAFTQFISVYGYANIVGHIFKLFSFWLIFYSIVRLSIEKPYAALSRTTSLLTSLRDGIPDLIFYKDKEGFYLGCNHAFCEFIGKKSPDEVIGVTDYDLFDKDIAGSFREKDASMLTQSAPQRNEEWVAYPDGRRVLLDTLKTPYLTNEGELIGLIGVSRDITAYKELEGKFLQAQKMEALGTLVGGIAHDFNNMIAAITGNLYLAKKRSTDLLYVEEKLDNIEKVSFSAADMIKQLLSFARKSRVEIKPLQLTPLVKETIQFMHSTIPENFTIQQNIGSVPLLINGDGTQLHQVLMNLVSNASDALEGSKSPCISIKLKAFHANKKFTQAHPDLHAKEYAHLSVEDNGEGIAESAIEHLFEPFFTTKEQGKGTGFGLAMVFGAVETHQGAIDVESVTGQGTTFHIYLPILESAEVEKEVAPLDLKATDGYGELILLVDDQESILEMGQEVLVSLGYKVLTAKNGQEAIEMYKTHADEIKLIIIDVVMPIMGGDLASQNIRQINPNVKIIFSTGYDKDTQLNMVNETVISKPFSIVKISHVIRQQLDS